ncbi:DUF4998 domain-containing protein [Marinoscillum sp. MHG1-6]|uniref:DUF4998 domain-containing protein n=1 Tax=Marinoscillum sp. MHG1-6 TaxID=2959627 RepID=UPI0021579559|nr:DUF4998 domain-containing protein [Marinoscillum sp. MHG1-6]
MRYITKDIINALIRSSVLVLIIILMGSCNEHEWDDFRKYSEGGEITYPGKFTSLDIFPGENRLKFMATLSPDARVSKFRIFWNDYADSLEYAVTSEMRTNGFVDTIAMEESLRSFVIHTYDDEGNISIPVTEIGVSYGDKYRATMKKKEVSSITATDSSTILYWKPFDTSTGAELTLLEYDSSGFTASFEAPANADSTELIGLTTSSTVKFLTEYLPSDDCIDKFFTDTTSYEVVR